MVYTSDTSLFWSVPEDPWDMDTLSVVRSVRALRILRLQGFHTARDLARGLHRGAFDAYPRWLRDHVEMSLARLRPLLDEANTRIRIKRHERRARIARIDWAQSVICRPLLQAEIAHTARIDVRDLSCVWAPKTAAARLGATDALDAALLPRAQILEQPGCGPARVDALRRAIERALVEPVPASWWHQPPSGQAPRYTLGGRTLSEAEVYRCHQEDAMSLDLPRRAVAAVTAAGLATCLDVAAAHVADLWHVRCGDRTIARLKVAIGERLASMAGSGA